MLAVLTFELELCSVFEPRRDTQVTLVTATTKPREAVGVA